MKIKIVLAFILFFSYTATAQTEFEAVGGINLGRISSKVNGEKEHGVKPAVGYMAGAHVGFAISKSCIFQTGLEFQSIHRSYKSSYTTGNPSSGQYEAGNTSNKLSLNYINIPLKIYLKNPTKENGIRVGAGPFIGFGVGGKSKSNDVYEETYNGITTTHTYNNSEKIKFGKNNSGLKRMNMGIGLNLNYIFPGYLTIGMYADLGLLDIDTSSAAKTTTYTVGLTAGYIFKSKTKTRSKSK